MDSLFCGFIGAVCLLIIAISCFIYAMRAVIRWAQPTELTPHGTISREEYEYGRQAAQDRLTRLMGPPDIPRELTDEHATIAPREELPP